MPNNSEAVSVLNKKNYVWYACYGSNLNKHRFMCYINGGTAPYSSSKQPNPGCKDKAKPLQNKQFEIPHRLYFAKQSSSWNNSGVAFISPEAEQDPSKWTKGRIWLITKNQFNDIWKQEGIEWYDKKITLGEEEGIEIKTITNKELLATNKPSEGYLKTMSLGLKETYNLSDQEIEIYLKRLT